MCGIIRFCCRSREEQRELVRWIEQRLSLLGKLQGATHRQIALLREYRTRLIADVVTGKLDVREAAANFRPGPGDALSHRLGTATAASTSATGGTGRAL